MEAPLRFKVVTTSGAGRAGELLAPHGPVVTPAFLPVATQGSIKTLTPEEVKAVGAGLVLANAYHLYLQPGVDTVREFGGLHSFIGWQGPILTDSGGFQAFSLGSLKKIEDEGILFRSHIDGSEHRFTPEAATFYQQELGADIIMCLDQCIAHGESLDAVRRAMERTHRWAARCKEAHGRSNAAERQALFGIVQGGVFPELRAQSAEHITLLDFDGYGIGGLAVGEAKRPMYDVVEQLDGLLPADKPRYLMGVGSPEDLVECVTRGVDLFDCALPTRVARNGALFTSMGRIDITKPRFKRAAGPLEDDCDCYTCLHFSTAYLHHLFKSKELLGLRLASIHNLRFVFRLMGDMRAAIVEDRFQSFKDRFLSAYKPTNELARQTQKESWMEFRNIRG